MKRSSPKRKTQLKRSTKRLRRSPLVRTVVNRIKPKGKPRFQKGRDPQYLEWIRSLPCLTKSWLCEGDIEAAHVKTRGAGGEDRGNVVPLCLFHHGCQHTQGIKTFADIRLGGLDELRRIAAEVYPAMYQKHLDLGWTPGRAADFPV